MLDEKLVQYIGYIQKAALQAGPGATQMALDNTRWGGIQDLFLGAVGLLTFLVSLWAVTRRWQWFDDKVGSAGPQILIPTIAGIIGIFVAGCTFLNLWDWISLFNPRLALFHDILDHLLNK